GTLAPGMRAVVFVELDLEPGALPGVLRHRVGYRVEDGTGAQADGVGGPAPVAPPAVALGQPLRGGPGAAVVEPGWARGDGGVAGRAAPSGRLPGGGWDGRAGGSGRGAGAGRAARRGAGAAAARRTVGGGVRSGVGTRASARVLHRGGTCHAARPP